MLNLISKDGKQYVSAKALYSGLQLDASNYSKWVDKHLINSTSTYKDFHSYQMTSEQKGRGKFSQDYLLEKNFAKFLCATSGSPNALPFVEWLIGLDNKVEEGLLLGADILPAIVELIQFFCIHEYRKEAERFHFKTFCETHYVGEWHAYRVSLLGYSKETLTTAMAQIGEKYSSIEKSLLKLDRYELIRTSFVDLFLHLGKSEVYAKNVGELASKMAKKMNLSFDSLKSALFGNLHPKMIQFDVAVRQLV